MTKAASSDKSRPSIWQRLIVPLALVVVWLAAAGFGGPYFGKISEVATNDPATFLPDSAEATRVNEKVNQFLDSSTVPAIVIFESDQQLTDEQVSSIENSREAVIQSRLAADDLPPLTKSEDEQAMLLIVPIDSEAEFAEAIPALKRTIEQSQPGVDVYYTGPALFSRDLQEAFAGIDGTLLAVALSVVFVILLFVYRSPILPIVTLVGAVAALSAAILLVYYLAKADLVLLNGQVQGILFILVIGAATDYSLLYIARYREELKRHKRSLDATIAAWRASVEPIAAAGGTVSLGLLCLMASDLGSNKALGPVGALGIALAVLVALTYLPAVLMLLGRVAFWPRPPRYGTTKLDRDYHSMHPAWSKVAALVSRHPRRIWVGTLAALLVACLFVPQFRAVGVAQDELILGPSDARDGQAALERHFPEGSGSPAYVVVPESSSEAVVAMLDADEGTDGVSLVSEDDERPRIPVGDSYAELRQSIRGEVARNLAEERALLRSGLERRMAGAPAEVIDEAYSRAVSQMPSVDQLAEQINPFGEAAALVIDDRVLLEVTLSDAASSEEARQTIERLRETVQADYPAVQFGGISAIQLDTNNASNRDLQVIIPMILTAITIVLMILLRSVVAPVILVITTVISFGSTIGIAALLFNNVWGFPGADPAVVIFGFVFLVALGIDYNIFLMTRVREETINYGVRTGTLKALIVTGGVITSAGIVLAATFAALYVIPILFLAQIAFIVAFGVLIDTLIVRSLLVPSLTLEIGKKMWWPSAISRNKRS